MALEHDQIPGGKADKASLNDFDPKQLAMGVKVEQEHTRDPQLAEEIASDHLAEHDTYYTALKKMEDRLEKGKSAAYCLGVQTAFRKIGSVAQKMRVLGVLARGEVNLFSRS